MTAARQAGADSCCGPPPPLACPLSSWPGAGCLLAGGQQAGKGARLRRCSARPCLVKEVACRGISIGRRVSRSGPRSLLFNVWAVRLLSLSGVTPRYWLGSASGPASCFAWQISSCLPGVPEAAQGRRSRVRGAGGRLPPTAMPHLRAMIAAGSAAAVVTRRSRRWPQGRAGAVVHECAGQAGDRVRGFLPAAGRSHLLQVARGAVDNGVPGTSGPVR